MRFTASARQSQETLASNAAVPGGSLVGSVV